MITIRTAAFLVPLAISLRAESPLRLTPSQTVIVTAANPADRERKAAELLREWLRKASRSGRGFEIQSEFPKTGNVIGIGPIPGAPAPPASRDGFRLVRRGRNIHIVGKTPHGTFYGAARFLDRFAGVRFYMPQEDFASLPATKTIVLDDVDMTEAPYVENSMMSGVGGFRGTGGQDAPVVRTEEAEWLYRNMAFRKEHPEFSHQHSMFQRFPPSKFAERMPEIYPILKGQRYVPSDPNDQKWQPCLTEPKLVDAAMESATAYFSEHPDRRYLSFSVQDSHSHCECARCLREVTAAGGNKPLAYSTMNARFLNAVAERLEKTLPGRTLVYIAYSEVREVPPVAMHPSILPVLVFTIGDSLIDKRFEPGSHILEQWGRFAQLGNHDWGQGNMYLIPRIYTGLTSRLFREARQRRLGWGYQHMESYPNWGLDGLKLWITAKIWWDPGVDVNALWKQAASDLFPSAPSDMERYFALLHDLWLAMDNDAERKLRKWSNQFELRDEKQRAMVAECRRLLDAAGRAAKPGAERRRVSLLSRSFGLSERFFAIANAPKTNTAQVEELRRHAREEITPDPWTFYGAGPSGELMKDVEAALAVITKGKLP